MGFINVSDAKCMAFVELKRFYESIGVDIHTLPENISLEDRLLLYAFWVGKSQASK